MNNTYCVVFSLRKRGYHTTSLRNYPHTKTATESATESFCRALFSTVYAIFTIEYFDHLRWLRAEMLRTNLDWLAKIQTTHGQTTSVQLRTIWTGSRHVAATFPTLRVR